MVRRHLAVVTAPAVVTERTSTLKVPLPCAFSLEYSRTAPATRGK
jgi:hypothetical protein